MKEKLSREMAARILHPDTSLEAQEEIGATMDDVNEACRMGAEALMPWVRTADRLPEGNDLDIVLVEYASDGLIFPTNIFNVRDKPYLMPWWMPIPPLPEHLADAGKKVEEPDRQDKVELKRSTAE